MGQDLERREEPRCLALSGSGPSVGTVLPLVVVARRTMRERPHASMVLSGLRATSPEALRRRLIGPWSEGLRQYLALALGDERRGAAVFAELKRLVSAMPTAELVRPPGPRARVYRFARRLVEERARLAGGSVPRGGKLVHRRAEVHGELATRLRQALPRAVAELLELRFARELSLEEMACVLDVDGAEDDPARAVAVVDRRLDEAIEAARAIAGPAFARESLPSLVVEAFALVLAGDDSSGDADEEGALAPGTVVGARYRVVRRVGVGAFGDVYEAVDQDVPGHRVALKILREPALSQAARDEALRELKLIAAVLHPSLVVFKDHGWFDDRLWFVMPWYDGVTLDRRIRERGGLGRAEARRIFEPLARALAALHAHGIRHQDVKPDNVLLAKLEGVGGAGESNDVLPILIDLGVAAEEHEALIGGTPLYFAPEVAAHYAGIESAPEVGPKADVFALALSLRNALEPESAEDVPAGAVETFIARRAERAPAPPSRREFRDLRRSFERWLHPEPTHRPTAEEFARELAILTAPQERAQRFRRTLAWAGPLFVALSAIFSAFVYVSKRDAELQQRELALVRRRVEEVRADWLAETARRAALDSDHAALLRRYEAASLSHEELTAELATSRGQLDVLVRQLSGAMAARDAAAAARDAAMAERDQLREQLAATTASARDLAAALALESSRAEDLATRARQAREEHARERASLETELGVARRHLEETTADLAAAREERDRAVERVRVLEARIANADGERDELLARLARMRERISALRERVTSEARAADTSDELPSSSETDSAHPLSDSGRDEAVRPG